MKNLFIPYQLAVLAQENGFKEPCNYLYRDELLLHTENHEWVNINRLPGRLAVSAPLYQQIVDWFREKHELLITIHRIGIGDQKYGYCWDITHIHKSPNRKLAVSGIDTADTHELYYEALDKAIEEAFKLIALPHNKESVSVNKHPISELKTPRSDRDNYDFYSATTKMAVNHYGWKSEHIRNRLDNFIANQDHNTLPYWIVKKLNEWDFEIKASDTFNHLNSSK